ncbi:pilin [Salinirussus salinus]|uniref:pilin n=1 Tax=Salinirussus salinus TaxID=1198300 RepID=UPI0019167FF4|nr:pilin [Salinirussus salinus]
MFAKLPRKTLKLWVFGLTSTALIQPAAAQNATDQLPCEPSDGLVPLFDFLNSITELAFLAGVGLATLTFVVAGICLILPGQDYTRLGKKIAKNGLIGAILLLSANMITSYLVAQLGANICA